MRQIFLVDDNFTVARRRAQALVEALAEWNQAHEGDRVRFLTQASIDVARNSDLLSACAAARLTDFYVGSETVNAESLRETRKRQNLLQPAGSRHAECRRRSAASPLGPPFRALVTDADRILLVFLGAGRRFWLLMGMLHRLLKPFGTHIVYLCDSRIVSYARGIDGLGNSYQQALAALRDLCRSLAPDRPRIFCFGQSMGGIGALRYGLDLGAEAVLATGAMTSLAANIGDPVPEDEKAVSRQLGADAVDLLPLFRAASVIPRVTLIHPGGMGRDTLHAQRFAGLPGARVVAIPDFDGHDVLPRLTAEHRFEREIALLLADEPA